MSGCRTHRLALHAREDDVEHLRERGLRRGLVDEVAAGQVDVVAGPDREEHRALVDLDVGGGHRRQQGLGGREWQLSKLSKGGGRCRVTVPASYLCGSSKTFARHPPLCCTRSRKQVFEFLPGKAALNPLR